MYRVAPVLLLLALSTTPGCKTTSPDGKPGASTSPTSAPDKQPSATTEKAPEKSLAKANIKRLGADAAGASKVYVAAPDGVFISDLNGDVLEAVTSERVHDCVVDHRVRVIWAATIEDDDTMTWRGIDLKTSPPTVHVIARGVATSGIDVRLAKDSDLGSYSPLDAHVSPMLDVSKEEPEMSVYIGCEGDAYYSGCRDQDGALAEDQQAIHDALLATEIESAAWLKQVAARRVEVAGMDRDSEVGRVDSVSQERCLESPEDCGLAYGVSETPYWRVIVWNDRGDYYHQGSQFYDPEKKRFFDPLAPDLASDAPIDPEKTVTPAEGLVAPSGEAFSTGESLISFERGAIIEGLTICGFDKPSSSFIDSI